MVIPLLHRQVPAATIWQQMLDQHETYAATSAYSCGVVAYACYRLEAYGSAQRWYRQLTRLDPHHADATLMLARIADQLTEPDRIEEAVAQLAA